MKLKLVFNDEVIRFDCESKINDAGLPSTPCVTEIPGEWFSETQDGLAQATVHALSPAYTYSSQPESLTIKQKISFSHPTHAGTGTSILKHNLC